MVSLCLEICWQNRILKTSFILQFNQFLGNEKSHSPNGRVICDLHSPDTFDTPLGERASAKVQPWIFKPREKIPSFRGTRVLENPSRSLHYWQPAPRKRLLLWMANPYNPTQPQATTQDWRPTSITKINKQKVWMEGRKRPAYSFFTTHYKLCNYSTTHLGSGSYFLTHALTLKHP